MSAINGQELSISIFDGLKIKTVRFFGIRFIGLIENLLATSSAHAPDAFTTISHFISLFMIHFLFLK